MKDAARSWVFFCKFGENFGVLLHRKKGERESEDIGKEKKTLGG